MAVDDQHLDCLLRMGEYFITEKLFDKALNILEKCKNINNKNSFVLHKLGIVYKLKGKYTEAQQLF